MTLKQKIDAYKAQFKTRAPREAQDVMRRATEDLSRSGILARAVKVGDKAPGFTLRNTDEKDVSLDDLLAAGPLVLGFYRGKW